MSAGINQHSLKYLMRQIFNAIGNALVKIFNTHKLFVGLLFILTAGNEYPLPEWLNILLGIIMMFTVVIWALSH